MDHPIEVTLDVRNVLSEVERANEGLRAWWTQQALPEDLEVPVTMCLEEVLSNVIRHGCAGVPDAHIRIAYRLIQEPSDGIEIEVVDDCRPFNPLTLPPPNLNIPLEQRRAGGLGVFLVRQLMDEVSYVFSEGRNRLSFRKLWNPPAA